MSVSTRSDKSVLPDQHPEGAKQPAKEPHPLDSLALSRFALVIDHEPANRDFLELLMQQAHYETAGITTGKAAQELAAALPFAPTIIVVDDKLPDMPGMALAPFFRQCYPDSRIILTATESSEALVAEAFNGGCNAFLVKPEGFKDLLKYLLLLDGNPSAIDGLVFDDQGVYFRE